MIETCFLSGEKNASRVLTLVTHAEQLLNLMNKKARNKYKVFMAKFCPQRKPSRGPLEDPHRDPGTMEGPLTPPNISEAATARDLRALTSWLEPYIHEEHRKSWKPETLVVGLFLVNN